MSTPLPAAVPPSRDWASLIPVAAGLVWLSLADGPVGLVIALLPGTLLIATGVSSLLWSGDGRITQYGALAGVLGLLFLLPGLFVLSFLGTVLAGLLSAAAFLHAGRTALRLAEPAPGAPEPPADLKTWAKAALDEALVGYFVSLAKIPAGAEAESLVRDAAVMEAVLAQRGWLDNPAAYHQTPGAPTDARLTPARFAGFEYEKLRFSSDFEPHPEVPGAALWQSYLPNRDCHASVFRQPQRGRPWLLCIHGYRMGTPFLDLRLFAPHILFKRLGLNLVMPVLPLHGPRRIGAQSGDHFLDGDPLDLLFAETQALWDLRRTVAWIRAQDPDARIGVLGYSLGGYNAALLATHETGLDFVISGIPVADFASVLWQHVPTPLRHYFEAEGLSRERYQRLLHVVSPLALPPKLPAERLHLFAGSADRVVPPVQPLKLAAHWQRNVHWFPGAHLTFRGERAVVRCIDDAMTGAGWKSAG
ncbi:prolyl oligopeptidase family serine peptidase [Nevskia sp.]|uniref:alpha/beta hydrolase family protein n=1 Tax=Nevskia sp. TaxID=1929292 RepID=UPI0025FE828E|nr:prolyl oligopeptidase family serine peptidase [Nevskia sp.]